MSDFQVVIWATYRQDIAMAIHGSAAEDSEQLLTVAAVARRLGIAPATLRTWDRRYGLGPSLHQEGQHRRYCPADLARLTLMRRLITAGVAPRDAAEKALVHKGRVSVKSLVKEFAVDQESVDSIYRALQLLDIKFVEEAVSYQIQDRGVIASWHEIIVPVLVAIGADWQATGEGIEIEHTFSEILKSVFLESTQEIKKPINARPVVLAAVGEELHTLPLHVLAAALSERDVDVYFLGARTPIEALAGTVSRIAPPAIFLYALLEKNADLKFITEIPSLRPSPRVLLGGPAWDSDNCGGATLVTGLDQACDEILQAIGA